MTETEKQKQYLSLLKSTISSREDIDKLLSKETFTKSVLEFLNRASDIISSKSLDTNLITVSYDIVSIISDKFQKKVEEGQNPFDPKMRSSIDKLLLSPKVLAYINNSYQVSQADQNIIKIAQHQLEQDKQISSQQYLRLHHFFSNIDLPAGSNYMHIDDGRHKKIELLIQDYESASSQTYQKKINSITDHLNKDSRSNSTKLQIKRSTVWIIIFSVVIASTALYYYLTPAQTASYSTSASIKHKRSVPHKSTNIDTKEQIERLSLKMAQDNGIGKTILLNESPTLTYPISMFKKGIKIDPIECQDRAIEIFTIDDMKIYCYSNDQIESI